MYPSFIFIYHDLSSFIIIYPSVSDDTTLPKNNSQNETSLPINFQVRSVSFC